jgi:hypothetical protein
MKHAVELEKGKSQRYAETIREMSGKIDSVANKNSQLY